MKQQTIESLLTMPSRMGGNTASIDPFDPSSTSSRNVIKAIIEDILQDKSTENIDFSDIASDVASELYNMPVIKLAIEKLENNNEPIDDFDHELQCAVDDAVRFALQTHKISRKR